MLFHFDSSFLNTGIIMAKSSSLDKPVGGVKGFFVRAGKSFYSGGLVARDLSLWLARQGGRWGLFVASTSMIVLMPLIFEINREAQVRVT